MSKQPKRSIKQPSLKTYKFTGHFLRIVSIPLALMSLLLLLAVPVAGLIGIFVSVFFFVIGCKYLKRSKPNKEASKEIERVEEPAPVIDDLEAQRAKAQKEAEEAKYRSEINRLSKCIHDFVVIDFETTGLNYPSLDRSSYDEILSVSIINQDGETLLDSLCKPQTKKSWPQAQEINGISPAMVKNAPTFEELFPTIKEILCKSKYVIAYNINFEFNFLRAFDCAFDFPGGTKIRENVVWGPDPMLMYCAYKANERWQKLSTVAKHFKFDYNAHNSLEDTKATLHCYKKLLEHVKSNPDKSYIVKYGYIYDDAIQGKWLDLTTSEISDATLIK